MITVPRFQRVVSLALLLCGGPLIFAHARAASLVSANDNFNGGRYLRSWLLLGPIQRTPPTSEAPTAAEQREVFLRDYLTADGGEEDAHPINAQSVAVPGRQLVWKRVDATNDFIDLGRELGRVDDAIAYAWTEAVATAPARGFLGLGSDDGVKVWVNGVLVHENWIERSANKNDDLVAVGLTRGTNQILVKVYNQRQDWRFTLRFVPPEEVAEKFIQSAASGRIEELEKMLRSGVEVNIADRTGLTALQAAQIHGYPRTSEFLTGHGADSKRAMPPAGRLVDGLFSSLLKVDSPGAAVLVAQDGQVLFEAGYGLANLEHRVPITAQTKFRIGSITKQFTATAILQLQEAGKLAVTNLLTTFYPGYPRGEEVTLHHLLTHTSGLHSYTDNPNFLKTVTAEITPDELIASFRDDPFDFSPGEKWHYCNSGYFLLGDIVTKVSGQAYGDYLREHIFRPVGMTNSGVYHWKDILDREAQGYGYENGRFFKALNWDMSRAGGAGILYSTVYDLYRWNEALFGGRVLSASSMRAAFRPVKLKSGEEALATIGKSYCYGWMKSQFRGLREVMHNGGLHGFSSCLTRYPEESLTVVVLANALPGPSGFDATRLAQSIAEIYLWPRLAPHNEPSLNTNVDTSIFPRYTGRYDLGYAQILTVSSEKDRLFAQITGQPRYEIFPLSTHEFFWKIVDAQVRFLTDETGRATKAVFRQDGPPLTAMRLPDEPAQKEDAAPTISGESLEALTGRYDYGQGAAILTVTRDGDKLFAQMSCQPKYEIFPKSATHFFWRVVPAEVEFVKDKEGKVIKVVHRQAGQTFDAPRLSP